MWPWAWGVVAAWLALNAGYAVGYMRGHRRARLKHIECHLSALQEAAGAVGKAAEAADIEAWEGEL